MHARYRFNICWVVALTCSTVAPRLSIAQPAESAVSGRPAGTIAFASLAPRDWDVYLKDDGW